MAVYIGASRGIRLDPSRAGTPLSQSQVSEPDHLLSLSSSPFYARIIPGSVSDPARKIAR